MDTRSPLSDADPIIYAGKSESMENLKNWIHWRRKKKFTHQSIEFFLLFTCVYILHSVFFSYLSSFSFDNNISKTNKQMLAP